MESLVARVVAYFRAVPLPVALVVGAFQVATTTAAFGSAGAWPAVALFSVASGVWCWDRWLGRVEPEELRELRARVVKISNKLGLGDTR